MVEGPNGAGRIETVSVVNGQLSSTPAPPAQDQSNGNRIASSHPDGETLPSTGPVTQGEILRQEQEAGIVLSNPHSIQPNRSIVGEIEGGGTIVETVEGEEEVPHARGPELIGMEDTGPQPSTSGLNIEAAVGRPPIERASKSPIPEVKDQAGASDTSSDTLVRDEVMTDIADAEAEAELKREEVDVKENDDFELVKHEDAEMKEDDPAQKSEA